MEYYQSIKVKLRKHTKQKLIAKIRFMYTILYIENKKMVNSLSNNKYSLFIKRIIIVE